MSTAGSASRAAPPAGPERAPAVPAVDELPIDDRRRSGLLFPTFGSDSRGGVDIGTPIYVNLAPNYDLTYTPRYISQRGLNHEVLGRYLDPWNGSGRPAAATSPTTSSTPMTSPMNRMRTAGWRRCATTGSTADAGAPSSTTRGSRTWT
jgi:lipopolysaccharide assembly outer membrane protein LptD (OstA)